MLFVNGFSSVCKFTDNPANCQRNYAKRGKEPCQHLVVSVFLYTFAAIIDRKRMELITKLYRQWSGVEPAAVEKLPGAGSNRVYYRIADAEGHTVIGCMGTSKEENDAFVTLARHFRTKGLPVPEVLAVSDDELCYLQQDLGSTSLFDALCKGREAGGKYDERERELLRQAMRLLPRMQFEGAEGLDFSVCYPQPEFDEINVMFDLNYFKYCFLKPSGIDFHELRLEHDFRQMAKDLTKELGSTFLYRDFQARNIMLCGNSLFCIDFQGGRRGPVYYDLASFLWQASARYPDDLRKDLLDVYYNEAQKFTILPSREEFNQRLSLFVLFRLMQVLGAYGYRGYFERKPHFIQSIPPAIESLKQQLEGMGDGYPHLMDVLRRLTSHLSPNIPHVNPLTSHPLPLTPKLVVRIFSFSYKKGIPQDESGNGGGYVFDCRGTHNPGRYEAYKHLTGLDDAVKKFLEDDGEILRFLDHVYQLADAHVQRYVERGFTSLLFCFGCTGGQHRSVYSAQHLAEHIHSKFPQVEVRLCHREQGISSILGE